VGKLLNLAGPDVRDDPSTSFPRRHWASAKSKIAATMSDLNSWEDDPAVQDDNLSRQTQQMNLNNAPPSGGFRPSANSFQPGAQSFQPGQQYQQYGGYDQYQQYPGQGQGYGYPQYGAQAGYGQYQQGGYGAGYGQGGYNAAYGIFTAIK
jgi:peptide chain release factor subunit 3